MAVEASTSRRAWFLVLEVLARSDEVDAAVLFDFITRMPQLSGDYGKEARELVAMKCLESLFAPVNEWETGTQPSELSKDGFNSSECCENVLQQILQETSVSNLRKNRPDDLGTKVRSFIKHKKAHLPRPALEQLKDTILQGNDPLAAALKRSCGLMAQNQSHADTGSPTLRREGTLVDGTSTPPTKLIYSPSLQEGNTVLLEKSSKFSASSCKRDWSCLGIKICGQDCPGNTENDSLLRKKTKQDAISCEPHAEHHSDPVDRIELSKDAIHNKPRDDCRSVPLDSTELYKDASERNALHIECEVHTSAPNILCMRKDTLSVDSDEPVAVSGKLDHNVGESSHLQPRKPQDASGNGDGPNACSDETKEDTEVYPKPIVSGDGHTNEVQSKTMAAENLESNDSHIQLIRADDTLPGKSLGQKIADEASNAMRNYGEMSWDSERFHDEKNVIARKKYDFMSSQQLLNEDPMAINDWTEKILCTKCSKGGELLSCSASGCPLVIHESCLGFSATFDDGGKFYCPFCAYSCAISVCIQAKKKASLARKALSQFISGETRCQPNDHSQRLPQNDNQERPKEDVHEMNEGNHVDNLVRSPKEGKQTEDVQQADIGSGTEENVPHQQVLDQNVQQADYGAQKEQQFLQPRITDQSKDAPCASGDNPNGAAEDGKGTDIQHKVLKQQILDQDIQQADTGAQTEQQVLKPMIPDQSKDAPCASSNNPSGAAEDENATASSYALRRQSREICYKFPATPQLRRKKVAWTTKEEDMLKEGVRRFAEGEDKSIPWKTILEFGSPVFHRGRTAVDLKDKWRNMVRAATTKAE